jgi:hypothetical protein
MRRAQVSALLGEEVWSRVLDDDGDEVLSFALHQLHIKKKKRQMAEDALVQALKAVFHSLHTRWRGVADDALFQAYDERSSRADDLRDVLSAPRKAQFALCAAVDPVDRLDGFNRTQGFPLWSASAPRDDLAHCSRAVRQKMANSLTTPRRMIFR